MVVEDRGVVVAIDFILLTPDAEESVDVVDRCPFLLEFELTELEGGFVGVRCPVRPQIFYEWGGVRW